MLDKRRTMMAAWADFCAMPHGESVGNVVSLRQA